VAHPMSEPWTIWHPIETAPKDCRIIAYGLIGYQTEPGVATVRWCDTHKQWEADPNECSEYSPEPCAVTHWMPLPEPPQSK